MSVTCGTLPRLRERGRGERGRGERQGEREGGRGPRGHDTGGERDIWSLHGFVDTSAVHTGKLKKI